MKKIVLGSVLALAAFSATGCIIESGDDGGTGDDGGGDDGFDAPKGQIDVSWKIRTAASTAALGCPTGVTTVAFHIQPIDDGNNDVGQEQIDLFNCTDGQGTAGATSLDAPDALPFGVYRTYAVFSSTGGAQKYAETPQWPDGLLDDEREDIADASTTAHASKSYDVFTDGGYFALGWTFAGGATCASANSDGVSAIAMLSSGGQSADEIFHCTAGYGISGGYSQGAYTASIAGLDGQLQIGTPVQKTFNIGVQNAVTDIGDVVLDNN